MINENVRRLLESATLVTGNPGKARELKRICGIEIAHEPVDLPEIQGLDLLTVLRSKTREAYRQLGRPVIVDETGLELAALNGFPGPLIKWLLQSIGAEGLGRLGQSLHDDRITAHCAVMFFDGEREVVGEGRTRGRLVFPPRGDDGFGWDPVFLPDGDGLTYAEMSAERKDEIGHRGKAWRELVRKMVSRA